MKNPLKIGLWHMAWRSLTRKKVRACLLSVSAAITSMVLFSAYFFIVSLENSFEASSARLGADIIVVPKGMGRQLEDLAISGFVSDKYLSENIVKEIESFDSVEIAAPQLYVSTVSTVCCGTEGDFPVVAFDPDKDFTLSSWLADKKELQPNEIVIGSEAGGKNFIYHYDNPYVEEWVTLFGNPFRVKNVLFPTGMSTDKTIFVRMDAIKKLAENHHPALAMPKDAVSLILVKTKPGTADFVQLNINQKYSDAEAVKGSALKETLSRQLFPMKLLSYSMILLVLIMNIFQVMTMYTALIGERKKEIGMLRAMGASKKSTFQLLLLETGMTSLLGAAAGAFLAGAILYDNRILILQLIQLPMRFPDWLSGMALGFAVIAIILLVSLLAALLPIYQMMKKEPYQLIREGE
ncbi:ABC transporter permease [Microaerobacter geothermalis]|uniref:ABC transporter permease n=1 Tax=Microaerobacter geothermalis TaxID=674972 RepID=UPI001F17E155|nr:ABC transporter permease [Microaerobacter geothermalis]MCF6092687.1 ABC transporter permease [Microaerobacter geothermalis]